MDNKINWMIRINPETKKRIKVVCAQQDRRMADIVEEAMQEWLKSRRNSRKGV